MPLALYPVIVTYCKGSKFNILLVEVLTKIYEGLSFVFKFVTELNGNITLLDPKAVILT